MKTKTTYTEVNAMNLGDARAALAMAEINYDAVTPEYRSTLAEWIVALKDRIRRLEVAK